MTCVVVGCFIGLVINCVFRRLAMILQGATPVGPLAGVDEEKGHGGSE